MNKEEIDSILKQADIKLGEKSDKQIQQYVSIEHKSQFKKRQSKGGDRIGKQHYENGTGLFGMDEKEKFKACSDGGKAATARPEWHDITIKAGTISAKSPNHPNNTLIKCIHCGMESTLPAISRWHNNNCKHK
jgi:hypothetical protein